MSSLTTIFFFGDHIHVSLFLGNLKGRTFGVDSQDWCKEKSFMSRARKIHLLRKLKSVRYLKRTGLVLLYVALLTLIMPRNFRLQYQYQVGKSWVEEDLQAAYDYSIFKDPDSLEVERLLIAAEVPDIYVKESREQQEQRVFETLNLFFEKAEVYQNTDKNF